MTVDEELEQQLLQLGNAVAPGSSIVDDVMARIANHRVAQPRFPSIKRWCSTMTHPRQIAATTAVIGLTLTAMYLLGLDQQPAVAFADQASAALERAKVHGVTVEERTVVIMSDGSRHTSSTVGTLFVGRDSYRRDIYDGDQLREIQWYTPDGEGMLQTSIRFDNNTYAVDRHRGSFGEVNPVARMRFLVGLTDKKDRRLDPTMIEGRQCIGFEIRANKYGNNPEDWIDRIWFDPRTKLPVRVEHEQPRTDDNFKAFIQVQEQFDWNPSLPADTFSPKIPKGFMNRRD